METKVVSSKYGEYVRYGMSWHWFKANYGKKRYQAIVQVGEHRVVYEVYFVHSRFLGHLDEHWVVCVNYMTMDDYRTCKSAMKACRDHVLKLRLEA